KLIKTTEKEHSNETKSENGKSSKAKSEQSQAKMIIKQEYRDAFNGVSMTLPGTLIETLLQSGLIERVWKNETVTLDLPESNSKEIEPKMIDSIPQIGVDRLHDEEITGEGIKVGVVDTGIDYNHPDLTNVYDGYRAKEGE